MFGKMKSRIRIYKQLWKIVWIVGLPKNQQIEA